MCCYFCDRTCVVNLYEMCVDYNYLIVFFLHEKVCVYVCFHQVFADWLIGDHCLGFFVCGWSFGMLIKWFWALSHLRFCRWGIDCSPYHFVVVPMMILAIMAESQGTKTCVPNLVDLCDLCAYIKRLHQHPISLQQIQAM